MLLCGSVAVADNGPSLPDDSLCRAEERFEVAIKGVTGAQIDVRVAVAGSRLCSFRTVDAGGAPVRVDIRLRDGEKGKKRLEIRVVENPATTRCRVASIDTFLAPGDSTMTGPSWDNLFDISLAKPRRPAEWR
jgi:hypothetical protein